MQSSRFALTQRSRALGRFISGFTLTGLLAIAGVMAPMTVSLVPVQAASSTTVTLDQNEAAFLPLINNFRAQNGLAPVQASVILTTSSRWMSNDMGTKNYFDHTDSLGRDLKTRLNSFGYSGSMGENIAAGYQSAQDVFTGWENSPGHRANMLNPDYKAIGIGRVTVPGSTYSTYWTTDFGDTVDQVVSPTSDLTTPTSTSRVTPPATSPVVHRVLKAKKPRVRFDWDAWLLQFMR